MQTPAWPTVPNGSEPVLDMTMPVSILPSHLTGVGWVYLRKDVDGITHFDYFPHMIIKGGGPSGPEYGSRLREWFSEVQRVAAENINRFEGEENWNYLAKWVWFTNRLEQARADLPDGLFETAAAD
jgi:hypothetical protein